MNKLYPLLLQPTLHTKVWGGRNLATVMNKNLPTDEPYGESWELHDSSTVENGVHVGKTIQELLQELGADLIGHNNDPNAGFPLLAKFLDANEWLSVQVHPNDEQAKRLEGDPRGKTEAWYILSATDAAQLVIGVQGGTSQAQMAQAIQDNQLEDLLVKVNVQAGDVLYMRANTVHALGPGNLIYEIQQSSDITYRLYDWGRMDLDGNPRQLHIEKGVEVSNLKSVPTIEHPDTTADTAVIVEGEYFKTLNHHLQDEQRIFQSNGFFHALTCTAGRLNITANDADVEVTKGRTVLIPASIMDYSIDGTGDILSSFQVT